MRSASIGAISTGDVVGRPDSVREQSDAQSQHGAFHHAKELYRFVAELLDGADRNVLAPMVARLNATLSFAYSHVRVSAALAVARDASFD
jgi:hypothetical protein